MEEYHLPTMDGLRLVKGLCEGVLIGKDAIAGFPSLHTLPHSGSLGFHHVNVFQSESRSETMVINIDNTFEGLKVEDLARAMIGKTTFAGWPFLQEAQVVAVSDDLFRYELEAFGQQQRVRPIPHRPEVIHAWRRTADRLEHVYSKRFGTLIGGVDVILHVKLLKGKLRHLMRGLVCGKRLTAIELGGTRPETAGRRRTSQGIRREGDRAGSPGNGTARIRRGHPVYCE